MRSLRVWFEGDSTGQIPQTAKLYLLTAIAPDESAASSLRAKSRDVVKAQQALDNAAVSSTNRTNKEAYEAYLGGQFYETHFNPRTNRGDRRIAHDYR